MSDVERLPDGDTIPVILYLNEAVYNRAELYCKQRGIDLRKIIEDNADTNLRGFLEKIGRDHHVTRPTNI